MTATTGHEPRSGTARVVSANGGGPAVAGGASAEAAPVGERP